jgi:hypothetical protein
MTTPHLEDLIGPNGETREWLILASIRAGGYPHVAAQAYGVSPKKLRRWTRRGRLARCVREAAARARLKAEMEAYEADSQFWLRHGPGKETRRAPGWSTSAKPAAEIGADSSQLLASPEFQTRVTSLLNALQAMPEARAIVAAVFAGNHHTQRNPK